ncbi:MAG: carboxypeptidase regulatory-like domain-containing protein, partial [Spirochaetales bacterium]|nr:carboxypeptidase regulatory-like domain-containing protein [Spirochaetales bacterium]
MRGLLKIMWVAIIMSVSLLFLASCTAEKTPGSITGRVELEDGASLAGLAITAVGSDNSTYKVLPDADGCFSFGNVQQGAYTISFSKPDYQSETRKSVEVRSGKNVDIGTVLMSFISGYVNGRITDSDGNPLPEAIVTIIGTNIRRYSGTTDASGNYSIRTKIGSYKEIDAFCGCWSGHYSLDSQIQVSEGRVVNVPEVYKLDLTHNFELSDMKEPSKTQTGFRRFLCSTCGLEKTEELSKVTGAKWAGVRVSPYGMVESFGSFPDVKTMAGFGADMENCLDGSLGTYILIVGTVDEDNWTCHLDFPLSKKISNAYGSDVDKYEEYLKAFDKAGYSVWLQVEPGDASLVELAKEVMNRYKHHSCVKGFGIDVEWYKPEGTGGKGTKLSDEPAVTSAVLKAVRA